jgi:hypothetical protein
VVFVRCADGPRLRRFGGNYSGHYFAHRDQKAWFLSAAPTDRACDASAAIAADIGLDRRQRAAVFAGCALAQGPCGAIAAIQAAAATHRNAA